MFEVVCVTQSTLCSGNFLSQIEKICKGGIDRIVLREKHLPESRYLGLAKEVDIICKNYGIPLTIHNFADTAKKLNAEYFHCPYAMAEQSINKFRKTGVSVHSTQEAVNAEKLGAYYITAGHVFETQCKAGLIPRGIEFIEDICNSVSIPVYAIGGINPENANLLKNTGIKGVCVMSSLMKTDNPEEYIMNLRF